jgi:hypothetical protein
VFGGGSGGGGRASCDCRGGGAAVVLLLVFVCVYLFVQLGWCGPRYVQMKGCAAGSSQPCI